MNGLQEEGKIGEETSLGSWHSNYSIGNRSLASKKIQSLGSEGEISWKLMKEKLAVIALKQSSKD